MIKNLPGEQWKPISFVGHEGMRNVYAVSNRGRICSFRNEVEADGKLLNGSLTTGYRTLNLHTRISKGTIYVHRAIADHFVKKPSPRHTALIHVNHDKLDNRPINLRWVKPADMVAHQQESPAKRAYKEAQANRQVGMKLTATQVKRIREQLANPNRRLTIRQIAEKYSVSEMTLYRIKSGENWSRVR
jgi:hypothetical protein